MLDHVASVDPLSASLAPCLLMQDNYSTGFVVMRIVAFGNLNTHIKNSAWHIIGAQQMSPKQTQLGGQVLHTKEWSPQGRR